MSLSFITEDVDKWFSHLENAGVSMKDGLYTSGRIPVRAFVALDPEKSYLEFDNFLEHEKNQAILKSLNYMRAKRDEGRSTHENPK